MTATSLVNLGDLFCTYAVEHEIANILSLLLYSSIQFKLLKLDFVGIYFIQSSLCK